jgi:hypothetical protein
MANNKDPNKKRPGEKEPGPFHYNPGNMSGKTAEGCKNQSQEQNNANKKKISGKEEQKRR